MKGTPKEEMLKSEITSLKKRLFDQNENRRTL